MSSITVAGRADYGARPPRRPLAPFRNAPAARAFLHHTVTPTYGTDWKRAARTVQQVAFDRGFSDTSYPVLVHPPTGTVIEGRGAQWVGAHTLGFNSTTPAVALIGNYENEPLSDLGVAAARYAFGLLVATGYLRARAPIDPHRLVYATACPGKYAVARLAEIRRPWSGGLPGGGEFVMDAEARKRFDELEATLGRWETDTRKEIIASIVAEGRKLRTTVWRAASRLVDVAEVVGKGRVKGRDEHRADPPPELE